MSRVLALAALLLSAPLAAHAQAQSTLPAAMAAQIDASVAAVLKANGTPSASIAVIKDGSIAYVKAYGDAQLSPRVPATTASRYQIASVSKEFVAAAVLLLQEEGKLSLDDKVSRWLPGLTDADQVSVRQLLTMTAGYSDFWPQDYMMLPLTKPTTPGAILDAWAKKPLDFKPGTAWQYSNTNYVIVGQIIEKVTGQPLFEVLQQRILRPLKITDATDADAVALKLPDALGYERAALGPNRRALQEGANWLYAAGQLGLTAEDLAKWDVSLINRSLLKPESYVAAFTPQKLSNGADSGYGLGLQIGRSDGRLMIHHGGEGAGYLAENRIYPDEKVGIVVLTNTFSGGSTGQIADRIAYLLLPPAGIDARIQALFEGLQQGKVDRAAFTENFNGYLTTQAVADYAQTLGPLGTPVSFRLKNTTNRGGMQFRSYGISAGGKLLNLSVYVTPAGKIEQFLVSETTG